MRTGIECLEGTFVAAKGLSLQDSAQISTLSGTSSTSFNIEEIHHEKIFIRHFSSVHVLRGRRPGQDQSFRNAFGERFNGNQPAPPLPLHHAGADPIHRWNEIAIDASGLDHTPVPPGDPRVFGEQLGPGRASRAMAIVHIAIFDTINAVDHRYHSFTGVHATHYPLSLIAAVSQSAHDTLVALYPSQTAAFNARLAEDLARVHNYHERANGIDLGRRVAAAILAQRQGDGSEIPEPRVGIDWITSDLPGHWRQDPISLIPLALGAHWGECRPFVLQSTHQFRIPPPPAMTSDAYTTAYNEVKNLGGDGIVTPTQRTAEQTFIGIFWAYDGTPSLCAPPRLYNQITVQIADRTRLQPVQFARLLALVNVAMAEAGMSAWESKYHYDFWRPITGIRESDPGTGPTGAGDGNPNTVGDPTFIRSARRPATCKAQTSRLRSRRILRVTPLLVAPSSKFFADSTEPITSVLRSSRTSSTESQETTPAMCVRTCRDISRDFRKRRKRTARAGFISGFTGHSTRPKGSRRAGASRITSTITPSRRCITDIVVRAHD